jgi:RES domain-containing protein
MPLDVDYIPINAEWWRHIPHGGDVYYRPPEPADGRWQRGEVIEAVYFADSPETAWAEWYRFLAELAVPPMQQMPRDLWRWSITLNAVADLSTAEQLARVGLELPPPGRASWPAYQDVGEQLLEDGWQGLLAPSAARPVGRVLCLFREARLIHGAIPVPPPEVWREPPVVPTGLRT